MSFVFCDYCGNKTQLVTGEAIYPTRTDLAHKLFYHCEPCGAYVGCHPGSDRPLGRLANAELRKAKMDAHGHFDPLWKSGLMKRKEAYAWLQKTLGLDRDKCHIGMFDVEQCKQVVAAVYMMGEK